MSKNILSNNNNNMKNKVLDLALSVFAGSALLILIGSFIELGKFAAGVFAAGAIAFYGWKNKWFKK